MLFYRVAKGLFTLYFKCMYSLNVHGLHNLPPQGPFIICANHTSWFDPPMVGCVLSGRNRIYFMAKEELFKVFILGALIKKLGAFPVKRNKADLGAIKHALKLLEKGGILGLFPEGTRTRNGELGELHNGAALIALMSKKPVLPVSVKWPGKIFGAVEVKIGPLIYFNEEGKIRGKVLDTASSRIREEIRKLL